MTSDSPHLRMGVLGVVVISLFAALFSRLWFLQVMSAPTLTVAPQTNRERVVRIAPVRGRIINAQGQARRQPPVERRHRRSQVRLGRARQGCPHRPSHAGARGAGRLAARTHRRSEVLAIAAHSARGGRARADGHAHRGATGRVPRRRGKGSGPTRVSLRHHAPRTCSVTSVPSTTPSTAR